MNKPVDGESGVSDDKDAMWRKRFQWFMLVRVIGLATFLLGIAIVYTDLLRPGGWPLVGGLVAIAGAIDSIFAPRLLKKLWQREPPFADHPPDGPTESM